MLYLRIFTSKSFRLACHINLGIVAGLTIGATMATILQCIPIRASWDRSIDATCTNSAAFWYAFAVTNIITDAIILFLPVREVLHLHLDRREKYGLLALFSLGAFSLQPPLIKPSTDLTPPQCDSIQRSPRNSSRKLHP